MEKGLELLHGLVWGVPMVGALFFLGLFLNIRCRFFPVRRLGTAIRRVLGRLGQKAERPGEVTPFQAVCTALASTIGTGNIAGVAGAVAIGGPGAIFWMWVSAVLGMGTKLFEIVLAMIFREKGPEGWAGGPMYTIKNGLGPSWRRLADAFCVLGLLAVLGSGSITQIGTMTAVLTETMGQYHLAPAAGTRFLLGMSLALMTILVFQGQAGGVTAVLEKLVPFMAAVYLLLGLGVLAVNWRAIPGAFGKIVEGAFSPGAVTGGAIGSVSRSLRCGAARGMFSHEAGQGTSPMAHAAASGQGPVEQGLYGIFEVFTDTLVICTLTALIVLCSGVEIPYGREAGSELVIAGLSRVYGKAAGILLAVVMSCFAYSTVLGWGFYGVRCWQFLFGTRGTRGFLILYAATAVPGTLMNTGMIWTLGETLNGLMAVPNLISLVLLSGTAAKRLRRWEMEEATGNGRRAAA